MEKIISTLRKIRLPAPAVIQQLSTHSGKLERWLGKEECEHLSKCTKDWYDRPIGISGVPGRVYAAAGGDFVGAIKGGGYTNLLEYQIERTKKIYKRWEKRQGRTLNAGFASLSELISEATSGGKSRDYFFNKVGVTGVVGATNTLWFEGNYPPAGSNAGAAAGGTAWDDSSTGTFPFTNPASGDTQHFVSANVFGTVSGMSLLLYDRLFSVTKTMSSSSTESVTGVPTRYQSQTSTDADYIGGNFLMIECRSALSATAHNWTTCTYNDEGGSSSTLPSVTGNSSNIAKRLDQPSGTWFCPLASGDRGIKALTQMQCSSASVTGAVDFTIGHPLAFIPVPLANFLSILDGINSAFNLARIFDDACLAFIEPLKSATTATTYSGIIKTVAS